MVRPIPEGYRRLTPYLILNHASDTIAFYQAAFDATEVMRLDDPSGQVHHAEIKIGNSPIMLADEMPAMDIRSPQTIGGTPVSIMLYMEGVDARFQQAIAARRDYADAINNLGGVYMRLGQTNDAIAAFRYGIEVVPDNELLYLNLAGVYWSFGSSERAREILKFLEKQHGPDPGLPEGPIRRKVKTGRALPNSLFAALPDPLLNELRQVDPNELTPEHALVLLRRLRELAG